MLQFNATDGVANLSAMASENGGKIVVLLERTGVYRLVADSQNPTGGMDVYDGNTTGFETRTDGVSPRTEATVWTVILIASLLPAMYMRWSISKQASNTDEEE